MILQQLLVFLSRSSHAMPPLLEKGWFFSFLTGDIPLPTSVFARVSTVGIQRSILVTDMHFLLPFSLLHFPQPSTPPPTDHNPSPTILLVPTPLPRCPSYTHSINNLPAKTPPLPIFPLFKCILSLTPLLLLYNPCLSLKP